MDGLEKAVLLAATGGAGTARVGATGAGGSPSSWPGSPEELIRAQEELAARQPPPWRLGRRALFSGCYICFGRGEDGAEPAWAGAALLLGHKLVALSVVAGRAGWPYVPGLLALREGPLLEAAVRDLPEQPDVVLVNATGRDHPRRAGLAVHLGAVLGIASVGVTDRPLLAAGAWPPEPRGSRAPLMLGEEVVGFWLRTRAGTGPVAVHAGWRTDADTAVEVVLAAARRARTPEPLRRARHAARLARASASAITGAL